MWTRGEGTRLELGRKNFIIESAGFVSTIWIHGHDAVDDEKEG